MIRKKIISPLEALWKATHTNNGITFIDSSNGDEFVSYYQLRNNAYQIYKFFKNKNIEKGSEIIFQFSSLKALAYTFWACLMGNFIPVPVAPINNEYTSVKLLSIYQTLNNPYLIFDKDNLIPSLEKFTSKTNELGNLDVLKSRSIDFNQIQLDSESISEVFDDDFDLSLNDDISYIQFSSGSTGNPKGVIINNINVAVNAYDIIERLNLKIEDSFMSWMPLTHDFSLVMFHLVPIILGVNQYLIPTNVYVRSSLLWFDKVNQYRASILGSPSFGIQHLLKFIKNKTISKNWDISCIKNLIVGAEQISYDLCREFYFKMKEYNIKNNVFIPGYGLAEATLVVTYGDPDADMKVHDLNRKYISVGKEVQYCNEANMHESIRFVEVGRPLESVQIKITDENDQILNDLTVGHIKVKGKNVSSGYYKNQKATNEIFSEDGWLNTGDIGFMNNGSLVMVGRAKEIITVKGVNYTCHDVEQTIIQNIDPDGLNKYVACNGFNNKTKCEQAIIFVYYKKKIDKFVEIASKIKQTVYEKIELAIDVVIPLTEIPKTTSGKIRRTELSNQYNRGEFEEIISEIHKDLNSENGNEVNFKSVTTKEKVFEYVTNAIESTLDLKITDYSIPFVDFGLESVNVPQFIERIQKDFNISIPVSTVFDYPSINKFVDYLFGELLKHDKSDIILENKYTKKHYHAEEKGVAVLGMSCRFPGGANDPESFWDLLIEGKSGIGEIPKDRWNSEKYYDEDKEAPGKMYTKRGGFLNIPVDEFDAQFFNISPKEAMALDPQQRIILELTWEAFENAGLDITKYFGTNTGVYVGISGEEYSYSHRNSGDAEKIDAYSLTGTTSSTACGRISYTFGFEGPCLSVDTACSSSLTALHIACKALESGEVDTAVIAGVNLILSPLAHICFSKLQAIAPDGCSKTFDASANGYGRAEGAAVIVLKRLRDAKKDNNKILGIIRGSGINQDGKSNGLTAPNGVAQQKVIQKALDAAGLGALDIDYMEMHGTGTPLGDPIEVNAVADTYCKNRSMGMPLKIGSVKSNIGHLEAAAGLASIIKVLLSFKNGIIPANLNFKNPNPYIPWDKLAVRIIDKNTPWDDKEKLRRAGINGFGFGGSNAHIIIEEPPKREYLVSSTEGFDYILKLSAKTPNSLRQYIKDYSDYIKKNSDLEINDIIHTANTSRTDFDFRISVVGKTREEILNKIDRYLDNDRMEGVFSNIDDENAVLQGKPQIVFMFSGQGSQYVGMGKELYDNNPIFKKAFDECDKLFRPYILKSLYNLIYSENASNEIIEKTLYAQPLIFSIQYSLYNVWKNMGITPQLVLGHSIGEYAAAVAAKILGLSDAVKLVAARGRLMDSAPGNGSMGAIFADEKTVKKLIQSYSKNVSIAAYNAQTSIVISGEKDSVQEILSQSEKSGIRVNRLHVSHGFHSPLMNPILEDFKSIAAEAQYNKTQTKYLSCMLGRLLEEQEILDAEYWTNHIKEMVAFYPSLLTVENMEDLVFVEIGPDRTLCSLSKMTIKENRLILPSLNRKKPDWEQIALSTGELYSRGIKVNWEKVSNKGSLSWQTVDLPMYPFDRKQFWMPPVYEYTKGTQSVGSNAYHPFIGQKITTPYLEDAVIYQSNFTSETPYFMKEHIIFDTAISPAAAHVSMLLSAAKQFDNPDSCIIENVEFRSPLLVNNYEERTVQVFVENTSEDTMKFQLVSKDSKKDNENWVKHCLGNLKSIKESKNDSVTSIEELRNKFPNEESEFDFYNAITNFGFNLGEGFQAIKKMWKADNEGICLINPKEDIPDINIYILYPGVIDSIFQTAMAIGAEELAANLDAGGRQRTAIPFSMKRLKYNYREAECYWCHTTVNVQKEIMLADIYVFNEKGETVFEIEQIMARLTDRTSLLKELINDHNQMFYHIQWLEKKINSKKIKFTNNDKIIVFADSKKDTEALENVLLQYKKKAIVVLVGNEYVKNSDDSYSISYESKEDFGQLLQDIYERNKADSFTILYLPEMGMEDPTADGLLRAQKRNCGGLLYLVQTLTEMQLAHSSKLWVITNNVQNIGDDEPVNIKQAALWGFSKVIRFEHPQLWGGIIDVGQDILLEKADELLREIRGGQDKEISLRGDSKKYIPQLIKNSEYLKSNKKEVNNHVDIKDTASYIITGGTGALGLIYSEYLIQKGAKHLVLVSRRRPNEDALKLINDWESKGVNVLLCQTDICNENDTKKLIARVKEEMPPIKGIIHAAGALDDKMIMDQTWESFERILMAKVMGTYNLHNELKEDELDFFEMLSSITSVVGNVGQSNYAAANYFLNVFSNYRKTQKVPSGSTCWGPWSGSGMAAENIGRMTKQGIYAISPESGMKIIDKLFAESFTNILVADINWQVYGNALETKDLNSFLSNVVAIKEGNSVAAEKGKKEIDVIANLKEMKPEDRKQYLLGYLQKNAARIMGFQNNQLPSLDTSLMEQGADSLMIFSMKTEINKFAGKQLDISLFFNYPSLRKLSDYLLSEVLFFEEHSDREIEDIQSTDEILAEISSLID